MADAPEIPDLRELLRRKSPTRARRTIEVPLDRALGAEIVALRERAAEVSLIEDERMGGGGVTVVNTDLAAKEAELAAKEVEFAASAVRFVLRAPSRPELAAIDDAMGDRDDADERGLRRLAAIIVEPEGTTWEILRELRDGGPDFEGIGSVAFAHFIEEPAGDMWAGDLTVPFSPTVLSTHGT